MRSIELGTVGEMRGELNRLVLAGEKTTTTGLYDEYARESEELECPGERLALLDDRQRAVAVIEITHVEVTAFGDVTWAHADAEGEGFTSVEDWRDGHSRYWTDLGTPVDDDSRVVCLAFRVVQVL